MFWLFYLLGGDINSFLPIVSNPADSTPTSDLTLEQLIKLILEDPTLDTGKPILEDPTSDTGKPILEDPTLDTGKPILEIHPRIQINLS